MIDFRYHLVSIVSVFLALALGLVLGSTVLQPYVQRTLQHQSRHEQARIKQLYAAERQLQGQISSDQAFAQVAEHQLLAHLLTGERVVMVEAPGASGQVVAGVKQALTAADAAITGEVQIQQNLFDPSSGSQSKLSLVAQQVAPPGMTLTAGTPLGQASQVLASALLTRDGPGQPVAGLRDSAGTAVLTGLAGAGFISVSQPLPARANLAVVIIPATPPATSDSSPPSQELVTLAQYLDQAGQGTVVAGSSAGSGPGSAIDVMRAGRAGKMSSVDNADTTTGQIVVAWALVQQLGGGNGSYGTASTASQVAPSPAPSASPTAAPSAATSRSGHQVPAPAGSVTP